MQTIKQGSTGEDVKKWQTIIGVKPDGNFGPATAAGTKLWQKAHGLKDDGIVGPNTWAKAQAAPTPKTAAVQNNVVTVNAAKTAASTIKAADQPVAKQAVKTATPSFGNPTLREGSSDKAAVARWQQIINVKPDGIFGPATTAGTKVWQRAHGLKDDGVVGPASWGKAAAVAAPTAQPTAAARAAQAQAATVNAATTAVRTIQPPKPPAPPKTAAEVIEVSKKIVTEKAKVVQAKAKDVHAKTVAHVKAAPIWQKIFGGALLGIGGLAVFKTFTEPKRRL